MLRDSTVHRLIFVFFFLSGLSSLVFEVIWARMLQQVFGTTSFAISTLLTAFMAGLALGSYLGGRIARRVGDQLRLYGILEGLIGLYALLVPVFLQVLPHLYGWLFNQFLDDFYLFSLLRFVAVFFILVIPTTLMGATLPLVSQWIADRQRLFQGQIGLLYGANTLGACIGCFSAGFLLLPTFGLSTTNSFFAALNGALAITVLLVSRRLADAVESTPEHQQASTDMEQAMGISAHPDPHPPWALSLILVGFAICGLASMSYQVLWTRAYLITLGSSTYSFTLVLTAVLVGIALGSAALSPVVKRIRRPLFWFALLQFGVVAFAALSFYTLNHIPLWLVHLLTNTIDSTVELYAFQFGLVALVVFIPSFLEGASFPVVIRAITARAQETGRDVGRAYAFNTTGAIIGSFAAGFILMPWLGLQGSILALLILNLLIALLLAIAEFYLRAQLSTVVTLVAGASVAVLVLIWAPPLDQAQITSGVFRAEVAHSIGDAERVAQRDPEILFYEDGLTATTSVERSGGTTTLRANGKPEASDGADMPTQVIVGLLPLMLRQSALGLEPGGEDVAMIGFGSGVTAGASLQWPLQSLDVVEIEASMIDASRHFEHVNFQPLSDPRLSIIESDGRNYVEYHDQEYDVIISEPSNPWIAGVSSLFTVEYFQRAAQRLADDGVYAQWVQLYEMHPDNVRTVFATFHHVFPHVQAYSTRPKSTDIVLIGSHQPLSFGPQGLPSSWAHGPVADALSDVGLYPDHDPLGRLFMNQNQIETFIDGAPKNTDDNGLLEFRAPRDVVFYHLGHDFFTDWYFNTPDYGDPRPHLSNWPDKEDWSPDQVASLLESLWRAGKPELAYSLLGDFNRSLSAPEESDLDSRLGHLQSAFYAHAQPLDQISEPWPTNEAPSKLQKLLSHVEHRRFRPAESMIDDLDEDHPLLDHPLFLYLKAYTFHIRRRYDESLDAYLDYAAAASPSSLAP